MVGFFKSLLSKEKKKILEKPNLSEKESEKKLEILAKDFDKEEIIFQIQQYLEKNDNPFDYATYILMHLPENNGYCFKIEYGMKNPTFVFYITIEQFQETIQIYDHIPSNYSSWAEMGMLPVLNLQKSINAMTYRVKLWKFIETITKQSKE